MNLSIYMKQDYGEIHALKITKNKPNFTVHSSWFVVHCKDRRKAA